MKMAHSVLNKSFFNFHPVKNGHSVRNKSFNFHPVKMAHSVLNKTFNFHPVKNGPLSAEQDL